MDAAASGMTILVDTRSDAHYPEFCAAARHRQVPLTLSVGLSLPGQTLGALNVYARTGQDITQEDIELAEQMASFAAVAVANAARFEDALALAADMQAAMRSRALIEQAKGILMERHGCDSAEAFSILRRASSSSNTKLREVAARLVAKEPSQA